MSFHCTNQKNLSKCSRTETHEEECLNSCHSPLSSLFLIVHHVVSYTIVVNFQLFFWNLGSCLLLQLSYLLVLLLHYQVVALTVTLLVAHNMDV